jgi:hypothetical protein
MNRILVRLALSAMVLGLTACGGNDDDASPAAQEPVRSKVTVEDLPAGSYVVSLGDLDAPQVGKYYAAADGSRLLVVSDGTDRAERLYRRAAGENWVAVPASPADVSVTLLRSGLSTAPAPAVASLAGNYVAQLSAGVLANFRIDAGGDIVAGASSCKLSGRLAPQGLPGTLKLSLATSGCGALPATSAGVATFDADYAPARLRLVTDDGTRPVDLWAYAD